jgi:hypothetical protein
MSVLAEESESSPRIQPSLQSLKTTCLREVAFNQDQKPKLRTINPYIPSQPHCLSAPLPSNFDTMPLM